MYLLLFHCPSQFARWRGSTSYCVLPEPCHLLREEMVFFLTLIIQKTHPQTPPKPQKLQTSGSGSQPDLFSVLFRFRDSTGGAYSQLCFEMSLAMAYIVKKAPCFPLVCKLIFPLLCSSINQDCILLSVLSC